MGRYYYDLHLHSCLSPCGDNDSTPFNMAGMGKLNGLDLMALTDHNTCRNCPAFFEAAAAYGVVPVPGMELTTAEDIHVICLFPTLESALAFDREVDSRRIRIPNRPKIFGEQILWSREDTPAGEEPDLLINATTVTLDEAAALAARYGGLCYPAHIDRQANGIIATLGMMPPTPRYTCVEFHDRDNIPAYTEKYGLAGKRVVVSSDAHDLGHIAERENYLELPGGSDDLVRRQLLDTLRGDVQ